MQRRHSLRRRHVAFTLAAVAALAGCTNSTSRTIDATTSSAATSTSTGATEPTTTTVSGSTTSDTAVATVVPSPATTPRGGAVTTTTLSPLLYIVPNITGIDVAVAEQLLSERQLGSLYVIVDDWQNAKGTVLSQTQAPGTVLGPGGIVAFRVSTGPVVAQIPNVVGLCEAAARTALNNAGFNVTMAYEQNAAKWKRVFGQTPLGSIFDQQGTTVTIKVSLNVTKDGC